MSKLRRGWPRINIAKASARGSRRNPTLKMRAAQPTRAKRSPAPGGTPKTGLHRWRG